MSLELITSGAAPTHTGRDLAGRRIGAYALRERIGEGGMGDVWLAERVDGRFEQQVAVKLLHSGLVLPSLAERFRREGAILAKLAHPNIARLIDAGHMIDGQPYMVLEHVQGQRIDAACDAQLLSVRERLRLFLQVLAAVSHAHARLVIHRDIKPENVLVTTDGAVKLLDFGIAKLTEKDDGTTHLTQLNGQPLTPEFAAPEQLDQGLVTTAADIYALGLLLFILLTGQHPRASLSGQRVKADTVIPRASRVVLLPDVDARWAQRLGCTAVKLSRQLHGDLDNILRKALKHDPAERYATVAAFEDDLRHHLAGETVSARRDSLYYRASRFVARNTLAVTLASLALVSIIATAAAAIVSARDARTQRDVALQQHRAALSASLFMAEMVGVKDAQGNPMEAGPWLKHVRRTAQEMFFDEPKVLSLLLPVLVLPNRRAGAIDEATAVLQDLNRLAQEHNDPVARAWSHCLSTMVTHRPERDAALLVELEATIVGLREGALSEFVRAQCLSTKAFFLTMVGRDQESLAAHDASRALVAKNQGLLRLTEAEALSARGTMLLFARRLAEADEQYQRWSQLLEQRNQSRSLDAATAFSYRGRVAALQGRWTDALKFHEQAADMARGMGGDNTAPAYMEYNVVLARTQLGDCTSAAPVLEHLLQGVQLNPPLWADAPRMTAQHQICAGQPDAALLTLNDAQAQGLGNAGAEAVALRQLLKIQLLGNTGRSMEALTAAEQMLAQLPKADWPHRLDALSLLAEAQNDLGRWHDAEKSTGEMTALLAEHRAQLGNTPNAHDGLTLLQQARAWAGQGRRPEAKVRAAAAHLHLVAALGPKAHATLAAEELLARL